MQLNLPPHLETLINKRLSERRIYETLRTRYAMLLKLRTRKKAGPTKNAARYRPTSRKALGKPNAGSFSTEHKPAAISRQ